MSELYQPTFGFIWLPKKFSPTNIRSILLFGNPNLSDAENEIIFEYVQIFIKISTRFDQQIDKRKQKKK